MMQIVQELCKRPGLNRTGFDMPTIYVPNMNQKVSTGIFIETWVFSYDTHQFCNILDIFL